MCYSIYQKAGIEVQVREITIYRLSAVDLPVHSLEVWNYWYKNVWFYRLGFTMTLRQFLSFFVFCTTKRNKPARTCSVPWCAKMAHGLVGGKLTVQNLNRLYEQRAEPRLNKAPNEPCLFRIESPRTNELCIDFLRGVHHDLLCRSQV